MDLENKDENLLFKFMPANLNLIRLLVNNSIWFSAFNKLNDPYEGKFAIEEMELPEDKILMKFYQTRKSFLLSENKAKQQIEKIKKNTSVFYSDLIKDLNNAYFNRLKVACFSLVYDEMLLWSHYADEHKGVCLIFEKDILTGPDSLEKFDEPIDYIEEKKVKPDFREKLQINFIDEGKIALSLKNDKEVIFKKLKCWEYEKEYRIFAKESFNNKTAGNSSKFNKQALKGIIFGERCSLDDIKLIHSILNVYGYVDNKFFWGASRIVPVTGKLVSIKEYGKIDIEAFLYKRKDWLKQVFL